jgi:hypothetical protein
MLFCEIRAVRRRLKNIKGLWHKELGPAFCGAEVHVTVTQRHLRFGNSDLANQELWRGEA